MTPFHALTRSELRAELSRELPDAERLSRRLFRAVYRHGAHSWGEVPGLSLEQWRWLEHNLELTSVALAKESRSAVSARSKQLFELGDGETFESALIHNRPRIDPAGEVRRLVGRLRRVGLRRFLRDVDAYEIRQLGERRGGPKPKLAACLSTQVGCAMACRFCGSGADGFTRHLAAHEIVAEVAALRVHNSVKSLAFMGMGEPLANLNNVVQACRILQDPEGAGYRDQRVTISTAGLVPQIDELSRLLTVRLAVSLNAANDELRDRLMPVNRRWNIATLLAACRRYAERARGPVVVEYMLLAGVNDRPADAETVARLLREMDVSLVLIPHNEHRDSPYSRPSATAVAAFRNLVAGRGIHVSVRGVPDRPSDNESACGQLRRGALAADGEGCALRPEPIGGTEREVLG